VTSPARGLPPRIYVPILVVGMLAFLSVVGYFLKIGLGVTGSALGPAAAPVTDTSQTAIGPNGVGGGSPAQVSAAGPPAPVQRLLVELRDRLQHDPNDGGALVSLGNLYSDAGKYEQALPYFARAVAHDPRDVRARTAYAAALHGTGQEGAALRQVQLALAEEPRSADALFIEGGVAAALGRRDLAAAAYRRFLEVAPNDERADDARSALGALGG